jgi:hypothetical protein
MKNAYRRGHMKTFAILLGLVVLVGCGEGRRPVQAEKPPAKEEIVYREDAIGGFRVYRAKINGNNYLIAKGSEGISIIPETPVREAENETVR